MLQHQFFKFLVVGGGATATQYLLLILVVEFTCLGPVPSAIVAYLAGAGVNYLGNYYFTFDSRRQHWQSMLRFVLVALLGLGLNTGLFWVGLQILPHYLWAQVMATGITLGINFILHRHFTFR